MVSGVSFKSNTCIFNVDVEKDEVPSFNLIVVINVHVSFLGQNAYTFRVLISYVIQY